MRQVRGKRWCGGFCGGGGIAPKLVLALTRLHTLATGQVVISMRLDDLRSVLDGLVGKTIRCDCGRSHNVHTRSVTIEPGAVARVPDLVERYFPQGKLLVVADPNTQAAAGNAVMDRLASKFQADLHLLGAEGDIPVGDETYVAAVRERLKQGYVAALAVGSGTINDLVKLAAEQVGLPYGVVCTAASMNGYTSSIAAIYVDMLKRTLPATPPVWVVADLDVLSAAPQEMTVAGLADLMSKPSSSSDWRSASLILGEYYCDYCADLSGMAEAACRAEAQAIGKGKAEGVALLVAGLILSGLSMAIAGSSSPASGGEHLISHVWDMRRLHEGKPHALHGAQAGLGTLMTASLWELLQTVPRPEEAQIQEIITARRPQEEEEADLMERLGPLAEASLAEYRRKRPDDQELRRRLEWLRDNWGEFWAAVKPLLRKSSELRDTLEEAGAPVTAREIGFTPEETEAAFRDARYVRSRYTVFDLAADLGVLEEFVAPALERSRVLE